jgi:hypothetical protein
MLSIHVIIAINLHGMRKDVKELLAVLHNH